MDDGSMLQFLFGLLTMGMVIGGVFVILAGGALLLATMMTLRQIQRQHEWERKRALLERLDEGQERREDRREARREDR
jgi:hypothetical protein